MSKKNLSIMSLLALSVALLGGCNGADKNVSDIVLEFEGKKYTADQLYNQLLASGTGANEAFSIVLRLVVESSMDTNVNIQTAADLAEEAFEEEVDAYAQSNGISTKNARKKLLEEKGYESVDELKADVIYEQKLTRVTEKYWDEKKGDFYKQYISDRLPYLVSHVLVKFDDNTNGNKIANNVNISQAEAEKLHDVITRFQNGDSFSYIANHFSDDSGSTATGGAYYMDTTTSFVDEFLYGTYIFDAYTEKVIEGAGETATAYYKWGQTGKYDLLKEKGFINESVYETPEGATEVFKQVDEYYKDGLNFVDMEIVNKLGEVANKTSTGDFHYIGYVKDENYDPDNGVTEYDSSINNLNSNYNAYARSIIFNRAFNKTGLSVIGYENPEDIPEGCENQFVEIRDAGTSKWVLATGTGTEKTPIFFVAAKGSSNDIWLHFLTINVSSLQDEYDYIKSKGQTEHYARNYFSIDPKDGGDHYALDPVFNVDGTNATKNKLIAEIESYVKSYATAGSGSTVGEESLLNFQMLRDYMTENKIKWDNTNLKTAIEAYMTRKENYLKTLHKNTLAESFNKHADKLTVSESELVQMGIKPYECAVTLSADAYAPINSSTSTGNLCRYVYGKGYQVKLSYYYHTNLEASGTSYTKLTNTSDILWFPEDENIPGGYKQWYYIGGENLIELPTEATGLKVKEGYTFEGWYTNSDLTGKPVTHIDLTKTSINNQTIFYAKVTPNQSSYVVHYDYKFVDSDTPVDADLIDEHDNLSSAAFVIGGNNTHTVYINNTADNKLITSDKFEILGFDANGDKVYEQEYSFTLDGQNVSKGVTVTVYVAPKVTENSKVKYVVVDETGKKIEGATGINKYPGEDEENGDTFTYDPKTDNKFIRKADDFVCANGYKITSILYATGENGYDRATEELVITQSLIGTTITVYVTVVQE